MKITEYSTIRERREGRCVVALGFFDGVHLAHRKLISDAVSEARRRGLDALVFTFRSESEDIKRGAKRLYSTEDKLSLIASLGVDEIVVADFSELSFMSAEEFVGGFLVGRLNCEIAACGFNFRFGHRGAADAARLDELMRRAGGGTIISGEIDYGEKPLSASLIRELIANRELRAANEALGEPYFITGTVGGGISLGARLGAPTANTPIDEGRLALPRGVYKTRVSLRGVEYPAVTNVGVCPTVGERALHAETHILNFKGNIYGERVKISFLDFIREEMQFDSEEALKMQINVDINKVLNEKD